MSHWNYRIFRHVYQNPITKKDEKYYAVHECYYDDNGNVNGWTKDAVGPTGETLDEIRQEYDDMAIAFDKPVLEYNDE